MLKSIWLDTITKKNYERLEKNIKTQILVIGGGISGISCAYELSNYYNDIVLVTMNEFYSGTTGFTTAKVTYQHDDIYHRLLNSYNEEVATNYYEFNKMGLERIKEIVNLEKVDCEFNEVDSYLFNYHNEEDIINDEYNAYQKLGIPGELTKFEEFDTLALKVSNQANFHPLKYLETLLSKLQEKGVKIYEQTKITSVIGITIITEDDYKINADKIIIATNYPIYPNVNLHFTKLIPSKSYVVVGKPKKDIKEGNYINPTEPVLSLRHYRDLLFVSGMSHDTKEMKDENTELNKLTDIGKERFEIEDFEFAWSTRDFKSVDMVPFIGKVASNIFLLTGYAKWGMTNSVAGSLLIKDLIIGNDSKFIETFDPLRNVMTKDFFKYNAGMVSTIIKSKKGFEKFEDLEQTEGKIFKFRNKRYGVYKDEENTLFVVKATCTHLGCGLTYNKVNRTYDCPCHGSKFNYDGTVLAGPAKKDLEKVKIKNDQK